MSQKMVEKKGDKVNLEYALSLTHLQRCGYDVLAVLDLELFLDATRQLQKLNCVYVQVYVQVLVRQCVGVIVGVCERERERE